MSNSGLSGNFQKKRQYGGPGVLSWAWTGLIAFIATGAIMIQAFGGSDPGREVVRIAIEGQPEKFAPLTDRENTAGQTSPKTPDQISAVQMPTPGSAASVNDPVALPADIKPQVVTEEDAVAIEGDSAAVIRLADLPSSSNSSKRAAEKIEIKGSLPRAPDPSLAMSTENGPYPRVAPDGRRAADYYRRGFDDPADRPRIAVIVAGLGLSTNLTAQAINDLPPEVTLAFAPYARDLPQWTNQARKAGHELMIELPMEASGVDPQALGPAALLSSRSENENRQRLNWLLARFPGYFAVTNYLGGTLSGKTAAVSPVYRQVREAGVGFIADTEIEPGNLNSSGLSAATTDLLISNTTTEPGSLLEQIETLARQKQSALVKIYPTEQSLAEISLWTKGLNEKGIALAPASSMLQ